MLVRNASISARNSSDSRRSASEAFRTSPAAPATLSAYEGRFVVVPMPNITHVFYGRDVGYVVERIVLDEATETISATKLRRLTSALR